MSVSRVDNKKSKALELGETVFAPYVQAWRGDLGDGAYGRLRDAVVVRMGQTRGLEELGGWLDAPDGPQAEVLELVAQIERDDHTALWEEPHTLGWFHQHFGASERDESNRAHNLYEAKHASGTVTTQLYTPRWIADLLVAEGLEAVQADPPTICDPAVGGGQMLLAALDALVDAGVGVDEAVRLLHGVDLDRRAVEACRRGLKLEVARRLGRRDRPLEAVIDRQIQVGDGLFDDLGSFELVVTNPPYMGSRSMPGELKRRIRGEFRPFHGDLYTAFIDRCHRLATGAVGVLAQQTVWYLSRFEKARRALLTRGDLRLFVHLGPHAFANLSGEKANVVAFVQEVGEPGERETMFVDLRDADGPHSKLEAFARGKAKRRSISTSTFAALPGHVLAHGLPRPLRELFATERRLGDIADIPGSQNKTGRNRTYVRDWSEVDPADIRPAPEIIGEAEGAEDEARWVFYSKGGRYAPWWGNWHNVVDWSTEARRFYDDNSTSNLLDSTWWFREGICYTDFGGRTFNARWMPPGCVFDMAGPAIFPRVEGDEAAYRRCLFALMAILNSTPVRALLNAMNPSLHYQVRDLRNLPVPEFDARLEARLARRGQELVRGMQRVARFVQDSPRSRLEGDADAARAFLEELPEAEHDLDRMVCELYGVPEMLVTPDERPEHDYVGKAEL